MTLLAHLLFVLTAQGAEPSERYEVFASRVQRLALEQATRISPAWDPLQRDCSGMIRFLFRSALGSTFKGWKRADGGVHAYASAEDLIHFNFNFLSLVADPAEIQTGDVLVFYSENKPLTERFHLMLAVKSQNRSEVLLIYHNGDTGPGGSVRKLSLQTLLLDRQNEWSPNAFNPRFKGVYRWDVWQK